MAKEIGYYSPELAKRIKDNALAWEKERQATQPIFRQTTPNPVYVYNASAHQIPRFGCMQMVGTQVIDGETFVKVDRPFDFTDSVMGPFLLNDMEAIESNEIGMAQFGPVFRAVSDGGTYSVGTRLGPVASSFELGKGPLFTYIGDDDFDDDVIKVVACETPLLAVAGVSGIAANSSGTVTAKAPASGNWTGGSITYTAWAPTSAPISANATVMIFPVDAKWVAVEIC